MEGQKIEIDVCNSLAAMAFVVADQQRMFREKDSKIQELEQKCKNFAGNLVSLESQCKTLDNKLSKSQDETEQLYKQLQESEERFADLVNKCSSIPTWERIDRDPEGNYIFDPEKKGKYLLRGKLEGDFIIYDMFNTRRKKGEYVYLGYETGESLPDLSNLSEVRSFFIGEFM